MQTITLNKTSKDSSSKTIVAINPERFKILTDITPFDFTTMLIAKSLVSPQLNLENISALGRTGAWGLILPGAITFHPMQAYYDMQTDLTIDWDEDTNCGLIGELKFDRYNTTFCPTLIDTFDIVSGSSIANYFETGQPRERVSTGLALSFVLGVFDGLDVAYIKTASSEIISQAIKVLGTFGLMGEYDGHEKHLRLSVVAGATDEVLNCLTRRGGLVGNCAINPDRYVTGPQMQQFEQVVRGDVRKHGYAFGKILCSEPPLHVAKALLESIKRYGLDQRDHDKFSRMNFDALTAHDMVRVFKVVDDIDQLAQTIAKEHAA